MILDKIHPSWFPIMNYLYKGALGDLNTNILPNISYCPERDFIFRALEDPMGSIKVVILGQDPFPTIGMGTGYAYLPQRNMIPPESTRIIEKGIKRSDPLGMHDTVAMDTWPKQGVLLLNAALTVETGSPGSHLIYWRDFMDNLIKYVATHIPCIWLLWGQYAQSFIPSISNDHILVKDYDRSTIELIPASPHKNYVMISDHPLNEEGNFNVNDHFYFVNRILSRQRKTNIVW